mgnify:CR=1 FL=1|tara:strand:+ start:100 stop:288 length:189 start_codon:yes stop_codon:yes gene_type:complete
MKRATLEIIDFNLVIKPPIVGTYCVKIYDDEEEMGGSFFNTIEEAEKYMREYQFDPEDLEDD